MRVKTQNNKNQESTIFFKKAKLQSATGKCQISAPKLLLYIYLFKFFIQGLVGSEVFLVCGRNMYRLSAVLLSLGSLFHHLGARKANSRDFVEYLALSE